MPVIYDSPSGGATTRPPKRKPKRKVLYAPQIKAKPKPKRTAPPPSPDRTDRTSAAAVERYKRSDRYVRALATAALAKEVQDRKRRLAARKDYRPKILGVIPSPVKEKPREVFGPRRPLSDREKTAVAKLRLKDSNRFDTKGKSLTELAELADTLKKAEKSKNPTKVAADFIKNKGALEAQQQAVGAQKAGQKLLEYSVRPLNATAGATSAALRGKNVAKAAGRGFTGKEKKTFSDVLKEQGVKRGAGTLGFVLDVGLDPTTYVSFGAGSVARKSAMKAALDAQKAAEKAARKAGATVAEAKLRGIDARKAAMAKATKEAKSKRPARHHESGLQIKVGGKALPGVERATGAARHGIRRGGQRVADVTPGRVRDTGRNVRNAVRRVGAASNANIRRVDPVTKQAQTVASQRSEKALRREAHAEQQQITRELHERVNALRGYVTKDEMRKVIDAIEAGDLKSLRNAPALKRGSVKRVRTRGMHKDSDRLIVAAKNIQDDLKYLNRVGRRSGAVTGRIGKQARSLQEVRQASTLARSPAKTSASLQEAVTDLKAARSELRNLPPTAKPSEKQAAKRSVRHAEQRVEFLRKRVVGMQRAQIAAATARHVRSVGRTNRRNTEARGYFPRVTKEETEKLGTLERIATERQTGKVPYYESVGSDRPNIGPGKRRQYRKSRADLEADPNTAHATAKLSEDIRPVMAKYAASVAKGTAAANLNTKLVRDMGTPLPRNVSKQQLREFEEAGYGVYRVRGGNLERLDPNENYGLISNASRAPTKQAHRGINPKTGKAYEAVPASRIPVDPKTGKAIGQKRGSGQVVLLDNASVNRVRDQGWKIEDPLLQGWDVLHRGFKRVALGTPGYLVRNLFGDTYNAWTDERAWRLMKNQARSRTILKDLARTERAARRFKRQIQPSQRTVKLTDAQAHEIAAHLKIPADQVSRNVKAEVVAKLAEDMGVIREGRFVELMEDASTKPRATGLWTDAVKRVEDQTRLATFLGGLQRGLSPREAADRSSKIHFDYGDLTSAEREIFRRFAPFYTFPARNIPHQAKALAKRPGKFAVVGKAVEEGRKAAGLEEDYAEGLNPYEQRQFGVPIKFGDKTYTLSLGLPFTDLNTVAEVVGGVATGVADLAGVDISKYTGSEGFTSAAKEAGQRVMETGSPIVKTPFEELANHSFFYRDEIQPDKEPFTRAPEWAIKAAKANPTIKRKLGLVDDYLPPDAPGKVWGWPRKMDYAFRQGQPGAIGPLLDVIGLGTKGANARQMTKAQRLIAFAGLRAIKYESDPAKLNALYDRRERVQTELDKLARRSGADPTLRGTSSNATKEGTRLNEELSAIESQIQELQLKERSKVGGLMENERVGPQTSKPTGLTGGRKPLTGGRRPLTGGRRPLTAARRPLTR